MFALLLVLVIIHWALHLPRASAGWWEPESLQRLVGCLQLNGGCGVRTGRLRVGMGSIGLREVRGVEALRPLDQIL
jgi:hypothetical protein